MLLTLKIYSLIWKRFNINFSACLIIKALLHESENTIEFEKSFLLFLF